VLRSEHELALRKERAAEIRAAFARAETGVEEQHFAAVPYSSVIAYINYLFRWQRRALVNTSDKGDCDVFLSKTYEVPEGKTGSDVDPGKMARIFSLPSDTADLGQTLVRLVREHSITDSETIPTKLLPVVPPPIPLTELRTVAELIDAYEAHRDCKLYSDVLASVLKKTGRVMPREVVWEFDGNWICHSEMAPGSPLLRGPNGDLIAYTNAAHIRLGPLLMWKNDIDGQQ
jgi:hypothetical protein